ncbi:butyrophilin subfamily 3 member A2-like [Clinocottus analis]|uniref:butyrophilin subfamily 3 member A2-like n=1 Tax=Clinocottus analis TaxID=304258 RepID=UPI0035C184EF
MKLRVPLLAALLLCCSGDSSLLGPPEMVLALAGGDVTLPCSFRIRANEDFPTVEWSKDGLKPNVVFLYRDGCETAEMKNPAFQYRTSLITKELSNGNISLRISNVQLSDAGRYRCLRLWRKKPRDVTVVKLVVGAVSDPKLSVTPAEGGGVTLRCAADCWLPAPEVFFLDERGVDAGGDEPKRDLDARGCYAVTRIATLRDATGSFTCRVHQADINQTRDVKILLPVVEKKSCVLTAGIAVVVVLLLVATCVSAVSLWKRFRKSAGEPSSPSSSYQSTPSVSSEDHLLQTSVQVIRVENVRNGAVEALAKEVEDLKLKLREKEDVVFQFRIAHEAHLAHKAHQAHLAHLAMCVCRDGESVFLPAASTESSSLTPGNLPQRRRPGISRQSSHPAHAASPPADRTDRRHSTPARLNSARPSGSRVGRSMSDTHAFRPGPNAKLQRPHSLVFPPSASSHNHFTRLKDVTEDSEMLIA